MMTKKKKPQMMQPHNINKLSHLMYVCQQYDHYYTWNPTPLESLLEFAKFNVTCLSMPRGK